MARCSVLALVIGAGLLTAPAADADLVGPPLPAPHVGAALNAPPPPLIAGQPGETISYSWQRCRRYGSLVAADAPADLWPLGEAGAVARDTRGGADGRYARTTHELTADGPLSGEVDFSSRFNGTSDAVAVAGAPDVFSGTHPHTVELWVRPQPIDARYRYLFSREFTTAAGRQGTGIWIQSRGIGFERYRDGVGSSITVASGLPEATWSHVVASYDGATMRLFINGAQVGSRASPTPLLAGGTLELGAGAGGASGFLAGDLDDAALYDRAVTRSHVAAHVAAARSLPCRIIDGAQGASYTPALADLGDTLQVMTIVNRTTPPAGNIASVSEGTAPADDAGQVVKPSIVTPAAGGTLGGTVQFTATVAGLPFDRAEFLVDGVVRHAKEEPSLNYTWYTNAEPNGTHTLAVRAYGPRATTPVTTTMNVTVSNKTVYPTPLPVGRESLYAEFNEGDAATANNLLDDVWPARGFPLPKLAGPLSWTEDPYNDAYWRFYHYGLRPEASLLYQWRATGDRRYLEKLVAILRSFTAYDATRPVNTRTFDNDHAAAYRAMTLVNYYWKLQQDGELPADLRSSLETSLAKLGAFLAVPSHFEGTYNHGFNEGAALLLIADNFPAMPGASAWRTTALARLQGMLDANLDADGVDVENSPFYHVYVLGLVYQIAQWASLHEPALAPSYTQAAQRMLRYAAYVTQPSGYLPMLGATATTFMPSQDPTVYGPMANTDPEFAFAYTRGARGTPPPDGTYLFPSSGLFVMRSPLGAPSNLAQQTFVTFDSGPYRTEHSDLDALGITMYSSGSTVLPESGLFTYTDQPDRSYFHGTRAHNTVVVDGADQAAGAAVPGPFGSIAGATWARGSSALYPGVTHARSVVVLRQGIALVVDRLAGSTAHSYTQTWHLPPDGTPAPSGQDVVVTSAVGKKILAIRQAEPAGESLGIARGQTSPVMQGWSSSSYGSKVPASALEYTRTGANAGFATLLTAGAYAAQSATVTTSQVAGGTRVDVCVAGTTGYAVTVPASDSAAVGVSGGACG